MSMDLTRQVDLSRRYKSWTYRFNIPDSETPRPSRNSLARMVINAPYDDAEEISLLAESRDTGRGSEFRRFNLDGASLTRIEEGGYDFELSFPEPRTTFDKWQEKNQGVSEDNALDIEMLEKTYPMVRFFECGAYFAGSKDHQHIVIKEHGFDQARTRRFMLYRDRTEQTVVEPLLDG